MKNRSIKRKAAVLLNYFGLLFIVLIVNNCNDSKQKISEVNPMNNAKLIIGQWQNPSQEGDLYEVWKKENDSLYIGKSYLIKGKDTVFNENIRIEKKGNQVFYIPTVTDQNGGKPVDFALTSFTENQLIFENPKHDFPQKISYTRISKDSLLAEISGTLKGKQHSEKFPMKKVK